MALDIPGVALPGATAGAPAGAASVDALTAAMAFPPLLQHASEYWIDSAQRMILFWDTIRQRGNVFNEHRAKGEPPVLDFEYDVVLNGRNLPRPCNYMLLQIRPKPGMTVDPKKRPFVIVDPRAGHGAGIGGMKEDSQVGVSLRAGHPTYFVAFTPMPVPGQKLSDIAAAEAKFIETVRQRHPEADGKPAVIGNCQAGWAVMSLSAVEPGLMGPVIIVGSPMSYWAGVDGKNPMRYMGGLIGGAWITSFLCDIGAGIFDGANLVANFERLNPANTYWAKNYNLYTNIDTEAERFLEFERWWTGFFFMTKQEMTRIVNELFVGNKLAAGKIRTETGAKLDLKDIAAPIVVFASGGDNITPPQQALNWIVDVYGSEDEIKIHGQTIVYIVHQDIGHLGIFVSGKVATKEHYEINEAVDFIDVLPPGLYEMVVEKMPKEAADRPEDLYMTRFEARTINDIRRLDDRQQDVEYFPSSKLLSEINTKFYDTFVGPWVKMMVTEPVAEVLRELHPLRIQHRFLSDDNPFMAPLKGLAASVREARQPASPDNLFVANEKKLSEGIIGVLDHYRDMRDKMQEQMFKAIYGPRALGGFLYSDEDVESAKFSPIVRSKREAAELEATIQRIKSRIEQGGFVEGWARIVAALMQGSGGINERELEAGRQVREQDPRLNVLSVAERRRLLKEQAHMLQLDEDGALRALPKLLTTPEERRQAWAIAKQIALGDGVVDDRQRVTLDRLSKALALEPTATAAE